MKRKAFKVIAKSLFREIKNSRVFMGDYTHAITSLSSLLALQNDW